MTIPSLW